MAFVCTRIYLVFKQTYIVTRVKKKNTPPRRLLLPLSVSFSVSLSLSFGANPGLLFFIFRKGSQSLTAVLIMSSPFAIQVIPSSDGREGHGGDESYGGRELHGLGTGYVPGEGLSRPERLGRGGQGPVDAARKRHRRDGEHGARGRRDVFEAIHLR